MSKLETVIMDKDMKLTHNERILIETIRWSGFGIDRVLLELQKFNESLKEKYKMPSNNEIAGNIKNALECINDKDRILQLKYNGFYE